MCRLSLSLQSHFLFLPFWEFFWVIVSPFPEKAQRYFVHRIKLRIKLGISHLYDGDLETVSVFRSVNVWTTNPSAYCPLHVFNMISLLNIFYKYTTCMKEVKQYAVQLFFTAIIKTIMRHSLIKFIHWIHIIVIISNCKE